MLCSRIVKDKFVPIKRNSFIDKFKKRRTQNIKRISCSLEEYKENEKKNIEIFFIREIANE